MNILQTESILSSMRMSGKGQAAGFSGAMEDLNKALRLNPADALFYYFRGNAEYHINDRKSASRDQGKSAELGYDEAIDMMNVNGN